jgi:acyl-CoA thioesterase-2
MPETVAELVETLELAPTDTPHLLRGDHVNTPFQRTYGGQVLAQALVAAYHEVPEDRVAHSLHAYFLKPGKTSHHIDYQTQELEDGRSFSARHVTALQDNRPIFIMSSSFHRPEGGLDHAEAQPIDVPAPGDCPLLLDVMNDRFGSSPIWHEWDALEVRFAGDSTTVPKQAQVGKPKAWMRVWVRTAAPLPQAGPIINHAVLAYLSDMTLLSVSALPHEIAFMSRQVQAASVGHSMWFHRPCRVDQWLLYDMVSPSAHDALGYSQGRLFQDGQLIASCSQEGLVRVVEDRDIFS